MRPTEKDCEACGNTFEVKPKGRIPDRCPDCRGKNSNKGAGVDGSASGGDASEAGASGSQPGAGDGADSHDVGHSDPEPAPVFDELTSLKVALDGGPVDLGPVEIVVPEHLDESGAVDLLEQSNDLDVELPDVPPRKDSVVWTGDNLTQVREVLDDGICVDVHRSNGRPFAEIYGKDRDWFITVHPGETVWRDGVVSR